MSDHHEFDIHQELNPLAFLSGHEGKSASPDQPIDSQSELSLDSLQHYLVDPAAKLPLNSDRLPIADKLLFEMGLLVEEEIAMIQKHQKKIAFWEERIESNKGDIKQNELQFKQNELASLLNRKNRDYWCGRAEGVDADYSHAEMAARGNDWAWLIKKYGLKNEDGTSIDPQAESVKELCKNQAKNLADQYRNAASQCEANRKEKEDENGRLLRENSCMLQTNETLQTYIAATYAGQIEPLQDGVLLFKELGLRLKSTFLNEKTSYGEIRGWAETFLDDFIKNNPKVPQDAVTHFRRLTSIPLPPEHC